MLKLTPPIQRCLTRGFTLLELMASVSITSVLIAIVAPNLNNFIVQLRVDNEISSLHRMLLITKNSAINSGQKTIICPLNNQSQCTGQWHKALSVFVDVNNNKKFDINEKIIYIKAEIAPDDKLIYGKGRNKIAYAPTGQLSGLDNGTFRYCPKDHDSMSRAIIVARSGRLYQSSDIDNDGVDENRTGKEIN